MARNARHRWLAAGLAAVTSTAIGISVTAAPSNPAQQVARTEPLAPPCIREFDGIPIYLDPCVTEAEPLPDDMPGQIAELRELIACSGAVVTLPEPEPTGPQPTASARETIRPSLTAEPVPSTAPSESPEPSTSPTTCPSPAPTGPAPTGPAPTPTNPAPTPSDPTPTPTDPTPTPTDPAPTGPPTGSPQPTSTVPTDPCAAGPELAADTPKDRDADRHCQVPADRTKDTVLVALGDSVTAGHHQTMSSTNLACKDANMAADFRNLPGNDMFFSYAGRYYRGNANISEYYNFARTGFDTDDVRTAVAARTDACANPWNRVKPPLGLAEDAIKDAKTKNKKAFAVVTGGINNTNWTDMIKEFAVCRIAQLATEAFKATALSTRDTHFRWFARGGGGPLNAPNDKIMENGGGCWAVWFVRRPFFPPLVLISRWGISQYNGPGSAAPGRWVPQIPFDAEAIVKALLNAGADKVVWMLYYDMIPATIDSAAFARSALRNAPVFQWAANAAPRLFNLGNVSLLPDELSIEKVQAYEKALNDAIKARFPVNAKLVALRPPMLFRGDIQNTAALGCPHPNAEGHKKLAATLKTVLG